jgi:predicted TIM-barrel fold metal-dependent hydrolase
MKITLALAAIPLLAACATTPRTAPLVDYHQHLVSPGFAPIVKMPERDGAALVRELDAAGIEKALVLSVGYSFADERKALPDPDQLTREQNDWTSAEVTKNARRLIGFCSANPLRHVALEELERCLGLPNMTGIKVHLGSSCSRWRSGVARRCSSTCAPAAARTTVPRMRGSSSSRSWRRRRTSRSSSHTSAPPGPATRRSTMK